MREIDLASQASSPLPPPCCLFLSEKIRKDSQPALRGWLGKEGKQKTCFLLGFCFLTYPRRVRVIQVFVLVHCSSCSTRPLRDLIHHCTLTTPTSQSSFSHIKLITSSFPRMTSWFTGLYLPRKHWPSSATTFPRLLPSATSKLTQDPLSNYFLLFFQDVC